MHAEQTLTARWLGRTPYAGAVELQAALVVERRRERIPDTLLLLEHPAVITLGRSADASHVLVDAATLERRGIEVHPCGRGGDVTYHGPGQLVGYPILALRSRERDAHIYLRHLEEALILCVAEWGVKASRKPGWTGIWVGEEKLAAIGVRLSTGWITSHGFALNVAADLDGFRYIVPCGIRERGVTSIETLTGGRVALETAGRRVAHHLAKTLGRNLLFEPPPRGAA